jgi:aromatic-amino-acid transaminase
MPAGSVVLLHACCHNPTGADLTDDQWTQVIEVVTARGLVPFLDMAYQGFGDGIAEDGQVVRRFAEAGGPLFVSNSFSKSFSLYGERVGALSIAAASAKKPPACCRNSSAWSAPTTPTRRSTAARWSQPCWHARTAPAVGRRTGRMRVRIREMRQLLVAKLKEKAPAMTSISSSSSAACSPTPA